MAANLAVTGGAGQRYFSAALTVSIAMIVLAYLFVFPAFVALRIRRPELERPFRVAGGIGGRLAGLDRRDRVVAARRRCACCGRDSAPPTRTPRCLRASKGERLQFELLVLAPVALVARARVRLLPAGRADAES